MDSWCGIEIRHLTALQAIEREGSFRGAAQRLGYVQSAISQQISQLERLVGTRLVERSRGQSQISLTPAGERLLEHADRVLMQLQAARADLEAPTTEGAERVRVGVFESVAAQIIPPVLMRLAAQSPQIDVTMVDVPADTNVFEAISDCKLDAAFAEVPPEGGPIEGKRLISDPCVLLVESGSPLAAAQRPPTLPEIAALPLVAHPAWRMTALIDAHFEAAGVRPNYRYSSDNNVAIQSLVCAGLAAAIMAELAVNDQDPRTHSIELDALPRRGIGLYWHQERGAGAGVTAFIEAVESVCAARGERPPAASAPALGAVAAGPPSR